VGSSDRFLAAAVADADEFCREVVLHIKNNLQPIVAAALFAGLCKISAAVPPELRTSAGISESDFFNELPVVLSVSRLAQPTREAPGAVTVIDAEMIRQSGARTVAELLRLVPGFQVAETAFGVPIAVYHGLTTEASGGLQVLVDGRTQYSPLWFGGVNWNAMQVSLADIERIEVVRGSNSAAFGANAVLGVLNIVTWEPSQTHGTRVSAAAGNRGTRELYARHGWGDDFGDYRISVEQTHTDGLEAFPDSRLQRRFSGRASLHLSNVDSLDVFAGGATMRQGDGYYPEPQTWLYDNPPRDRNLASYYAQVGWTRQLGDGEELRLRYFRVRETGKMRFRADFDLDGDFVADAYALLNYDPTVTRDDVELQHTLSGGDLRLVWGIGARRDSVRGRQIYATDSPITVDLLRAFGNLEWRMTKSLLLNFGATSEKDSITGTTTAPRVMLNWLATPSQTLRAGVSRAYRTPSIYEQRANSQLVDQSGILQMFTGSSVFQEELAVRTLAPEELTSYETGYLGEWKAQGMLLDLRAFREEIRGRVIHFPLPSPETYRTWSNGENVDIVGIEGQFRWTPHPDTRLMINHAIIDIKSATYSSDIPAFMWQGNDDYTQHSAPANQTSLHWVQKIPGGLESSLAYYRIPSYKWTRNTSIPDYTRIDWRLGYPFRMNGRKGELALTWRGIGGQHAEFRYEDGTNRYKQQLVGPVAFGSLRLDF
jgi:iron complex outermembrane recepter protein